MLVVTIRPEPGCSATVEAALALGLEVAGWPLFEIRACTWEPPAPDSIDALLIGSANAVRHFGPALERYRAKPVFAVGRATAAAADAAGLTVAATGSEDLQRLLDTLAAPMRLLRVTGAEHVALAAPAGLEIVTRVAYESVPAPLSPERAEQVGGGSLVLLHSAAAARHFAGECDRLLVARQNVGLAALAPRIAEGAGEGWREVRWAPDPNEAALLALARDMCQNQRRD